MPNKKLTPQEQQEVQQSFQYFLQTLSGNEPGRAFGNLNSKPMSNATLKLVNTLVHRYIKLTPTQQKRFLTWYGSVLEQVFATRYMNRALKKAS